MPGPREAGGKGVDLQNSKAPYAVKGVGTAPLYIEPQAEQLNVRHLWGLAAEILSSGRG